MDDRLDRGNLDGGAEHMKKRRKRRSEATEDLLAEVREIYRELSERPIERNCTLRTECCRFKVTGLTPFLTKGEAIVAALGWRATGRTTLPERADGSCPMLHPETGRCLVYESRPFGCRTHFCAAAGGPWARRDVIDLIRRLETVDAQLGGDGSRPLPAAVRDALRAME